MYNREEAAQRAEKTKTYAEGMCQKWTREVFGAPSAGDRDGDGDADAVDGWKSEPVAHRHPKDRNPPRGVPVSFGGGSKGHGHRAVSLGGGAIKSTDVTGKRYTAGFVGVTTIEDIERVLGVHYLGWSNTITGRLIPMPPPPPKPKTRGKRVDRAIKNLRRTDSKPGSLRRRSINKALTWLRKIPKK